MEYTVIGNDSDFINMVNLYPKKPYCVRSMKYLLAHIINVNNTRYAGHAVLLAT